MSRCCTGVDLWPLILVSQHFFPTQLLLTGHFLPFGCLVGTVLNKVATVFMYFCCVFNFWWQAEFGDFSASRRERVGLSRSHTGTKSINTQNTLTSPVWTTFHAVKKCLWFRNLHPLFNLHFFKCNSFMQCIVSSCDSEPPPCVATLDSVCHQP